MLELNVAVTCSSNINRSMEAHAYLAKKNLRVRSFGTGDKVRLPGESPDRPNCYDFGTPYSAIYEDLSKKDHGYYAQNGLLSLIDRNRKIKACPERFQDTNEMFDVIITCEERVFDQVLEWFNSRQSSTNHSVHIVNVEIEDNMEDATIGSFLIFDIVTMMSQCKDLNVNIDVLIHALETKFKKTFLCVTMFY